MSMNILIEARRQVQVLKTGKISEQRITFDTWQTRTQVTMQILNSTDPASVFKDWVLSISEDHTVAVFAEDDIWEEGDPIGTKVVSPGKEAEAEFDDWLKMCEEEGYEVSFSMI
jgi:hypothetical protein